MIALDPRPSCARMLLVARKLLPFVRAGARGTLGVRVRVEG